MSDAPEYDPDDPAHEAGHHYCTKCWKPGNSETLRYMGDGRALCEACLAEEPEEPAPTLPAGETCCVYRRKVMVGVIGVLPEEVCGVPDSALADILRFDIDLPTRHPVLGFRFCPWCGKPFTDKSEVAITDYEVTDPDEDDDA